MLEVDEGFVFFLDFFFRAAIASGFQGHRDLANFLRGAVQVAEAFSPQRFCEENAVVRFISLS